MAEWSNIQYNGESVGTLYTENERFGFVPVVQTSAATKGFAVVSSLIKAALIADLPAEDAYFGILGSLDKRDGFSYEEGSGETVEKPETDTTGLAASAVEDLPSPYYVTMQPDGTVLQLIQETGEEPLLRSGGEWVEFPDEDEDADDGLGIAHVTEESVTTYDKLVTSNKAPTIADLEVVPFE